MREKSSNAITCEKELNDLLTLAKHKLTLRTHEDTTSRDFQPHFD